MGGPPAGAASAKINYFSELRYERYERYELALV